MSFELKITETTVYRREVTLEQLEEQAGFTLEDAEIAVRSSDRAPITDEEVRDWALSHLADAAQENADDDFRQWVERHGDLNGQEWELVELNDEGDQQ